MTPRQKQAIQRLVAYTDFAWPCESAIDLFFRVTDHGESPYQGYALPTREGLEFKCLLDAHTIHSRQPSPILEGVWLDGMYDIPLRRIVVEYLRDSFGGPWPRKLPGFARAYNLSAQIHQSGVL